MTNIVVVVVVVVVVVREHVQTILTIGLKLMRPVHVYVQLSGNKIRNFTTALEPFTGHDVEIFTSPSHPYAPF
jgi:hypothetical protein